MKSFFNKRNVLIIICAALAALMAVAAVILFTNGETAAPTITESSSSLLEESSSSIIESSSSVPEPSSSSQPEIELKVTSHRATDVTVWEPITVFSGICDPNEPLLINDEEISCSQDGTFSAEYKLSVGNNYFKFSHKGKEATYIVRYRYDVITDYSPKSKQTFESGSSFAVTVKARVGSTVTATFDNKTITLVRNDTQGGDEENTESDTFVNYQGTFALPSGNKTDLNLGKVKITATCNGVTETEESGDIICKKIEIPVVAEIVAFSAETFDGDSSDDASRPTNNYLPKGTVDYVVGRVYNGDKEYLLLRCGRRVYVEKKAVPTKEYEAVAKEYEATLPDKNNLSISSFKTGERHSVLTLDSEWKAPFYFDLLPQKYTNPKYQDYTVSSVTCEYVDITFCYSASLGGSVKIDESNPLFKSSEILTKDGNKVLRLYLKKTGAFYGWNAFYNDAGQLVFEFLHPVQVKESNNKYGADLTGAVIMLDVGHGGIDVGAVGIGGAYYEAERNLYLAKLIKAELETTGATVILNRSGDTTLTADERCIMLKNAKPDLCIAIHHDSNASSKPSGFGAYHSTLFSNDAARFIFAESEKLAVYKNASLNRFRWHYYFVARMTDCPVVLTENGFMSSPTDYDGITGEAGNKAKAEAIVRGTVKYFLSIRNDEIKEPDISSESSSSEPLESSSEPVVSEEP